MAVSQIFYDQYHILDIYIWKFFVEKTTEGWKSQCSAKMGADSLAKNTPNAQRLIWLNCQISPKVWISLKKGFIELP
jgi:hypothetical protein